MAGEEDEAYIYAQQIACASVLPLVVKSAIEMDLLELIKKAGPGAYVSASELASQLPTQNPAEAAVTLDRILRLLATYSVLKCTLQNLPEGGGVQRLYGLAPVCKFWTKNEEDGISVASDLLLLNHDKVFIESWYHLKDVVLDGGIPFNRAYGMTTFEYKVRDSRFNKVFNRAMSTHSTITMKKILETYHGFEGLNTLVDVGGGIGASLSVIISKYPNIKGINFDLPNVIEDAARFNPGMDHVAGDMFVGVPNGDAIFMKWICHDWTDEDCVKILKNCHRSLPEKGKVILAESVLTELPEETFENQNSAMVDMVMLAQTPGGKVRTEKQFQELAINAGFKPFRKICSAYNTWIMEFPK